jgi:CheY-like chemotaxis protein
VSILAKLLIVEDDKALLGALEALLSANGHKVQAVDSGETALDTLDVSADNLPDLIIADVMMPGITGRELLDDVRAIPLCKDIPFLIISASITPEAEKEIAALEGVIFLRKPFDSATLYKAVSSALQAH